MEDLDNKEERKYKSWSVEKDRRGYIMRVIYDSTRSKMLVVNVRVIYVRQNLAEDRS